MLRAMESRISRKNAIALFALAVLVACICSSAVNEMVDTILPQKTVTVTVGAPSEGGGNEVWVFEDSQKNNLFQQCKTGTWDGNWEYRDAVEHGYAGNMICSYGSNEGATISFSAPASSTGYLMFWKNTSGGSVTVSVDGIVQEIGLNSHVSGGEMEKVFPFENSLIPVIYRLIAYGVLTLLAFALLLLFFFRLSKGKSVGSFWSREIKWWYIFPLWVALYAFAVIQYKNGWIPNFLEFGDQVYYWNISLLTDGVWDAAAVAAQTVSFRGYLTHFAPTFSRTLGAALNIDPVHLYFLFPSAAIAWLSGYLLPGFYSVLTRKRATLLQFTVFSMVYLFFWTGTLTAVLVDLLGAVAFFSGVLFSIRFWQERKLAFALLTGFFWAVACNLRTAYQYGILVLGGFAVVMLLTRAYKARREVAKLAKGTFPKYVVSVLVGGVGFVTAFFLICVPQMQINAAKGHPGLLPYDTDGALVELDSNTPASLLESSGNLSLSVSYTGYPYMCSDDQMLSIKSQGTNPATPLFDAGDFLTVPQLLRVYAQSPLESLVLIAKKLFLAFDAKTNISYPAHLFWRWSSGLTYSLLNYTVLASGLYILLFHRKVQKGERVIAGAFFCGLILPQMFVHVEWRYFLTSYLLLYYFFAYHFVGTVVVQPEEWRQLTEKNYLPYLVTFILCSFLVSLTLYA